MTRRFLCDSCGQTFTTRRSVARGCGGRAFLRGLASLPLALLVLWFLLRNPHYGDRVVLYEAVSSLLEAYRHPIWAGIASVAAALLIAAGRSVRTEVAPVSERPLEIQVREDAGERIAVIVPGGAAALDRDFVFDRGLGQEAALLGRLSELATRSISFPERGPGPATDDATRELHREIYSVGLSLADVLMGPDGDLRDVVYDLPGDHLLLRVQPALAHLPWELVVPRAGAEYLWQRFHVGRQVVQERAPVGRTASRGERLRVLVIANPESAVPGRDLPAAETEAAELLELAALYPETLRVVRRSPRSLEELRGAVAESFDVIHFAGHTTDTEGRRGWVLAAGEAVDPGEAVASSGTPPSLVFANACGWGARARMSSWTVEGPVGMLSAGVGAHIGTLWELPDRQAAHMSRVFYRNLLAGRTVGQSLTAARAAHMGLSPFGWANYVLYGDPSARLCQRP